MQPSLTFRMDVPADHQNGIAVAPMHLPILSTTES